MSKTTNLTWGLYNISPRYPFNWLKYTIKDTWIMLKRLVFVVRHGYYPQAEWETFTYFIDMYKDIFNWYLHERSADIPFEGVDEKDYQKKNDEFYTNLIGLLEVMRDYDEWEQAVAARDEFFDLMKKNFYHLWD